MPQSQIKNDLGKSPWTAAVVSAELYSNGNAGNFFSLSVVCCDCCIKASLIFTTAGFLHFLFSLHLTCHRKLSFIPVINLPSSLFLRKQKSEDYKVQKQTGCHRHLLSHSAKTTLATLSFILCKVVGITLCSIYTTVRKFTALMSIF